LAEWGPQKDAVAEAAQQVDVGASGVWYAAVAMKQPWSTVNCCLPVRSWTKAPGDGCTQALSARTPM
jgi:hypothetical protein